jgi:hypothetical protein
MGKLLVRLEPDDQEDNEYSTPCYFTFDETNDIATFLKLVVKHGDHVSMYIKESE